MIKRGCRVSHGAVQREPRLVNRTDDVNEAVCATSVPFSFTNSLKNLGETSFEITIIVQSRLIAMIRRIHG